MGLRHVNINVNNRYVNHYNRNNNINRSGGTWNHNPPHRGGAPYGDRATADRFGGTARGDSVATRRAAARQNSGAAARTQTAAGANRSGTAGANRAGASAARAARARTAARPGAADRVGNRSIPSSHSSSRSGSAFGGASSSRPTSSAARSSSQRGSCSMGGSRAGWWRREAEVTGHDDSTHDQDLARSMAMLRIAMTALALGLSGAPSISSQTADAEPAQSRPPRPCRRRAPSVRHGAGGRDALIQAAATFDEPALVAMFGPDGKDLVTTEDPVRDKSYALAFAALAKEGHAVAVIRQLPAGPRCRWARTTGRCPCRS